MIKMEKNCRSPKCDVIMEGRKIGYMEWVNLIKWFMKNRHTYKGTFSRFITENPENSQSGIQIDIIIAEKKLVIKDARVEWMKSPLNNGTFRAEKIESYANLIN
jgi:hypothetical protein